MLFREAFSPTPVLQIADFSSVFGGKNRDRLLLDEKGHMRALEYVAFPQTLFRVLEEKPHHILRVCIPSYSTEKFFYIDSRFTSPCNERNEILSPLSSIDQILDKLNNLQGTTYLWGGNYSPGIEQLLTLYPPDKQLDLTTKNHWMLKGVDCSGLLFEVTKGRTPRNTSQLVHFGRPLTIESLSLKSLLSLLRPLDLLVYVGHVIIVLDSSFTIESREKKGVVKTPLKERLDELLQQRQPKNFWPEKTSSTSFVIRRWYAY